MMTQHPLSVMFPLHWLWTRMKRKMLKMSWKAVTVTQIDQEVKLFKR